MAFYRDRMGVQIRKLSSLNSSDSELVKLVVNSGNHRYGFERLLVSTLGGTAETIRPIGLNVL